MNGLILIDKPAGWTSHDVVNAWRRMARTKRTGHLGTLDPAATGLLALLTGKATRLAQFCDKEDKTYLAEIRFGFVSETYDAEGNVVPTGAPAPAQADVIAALERFRGPFLQTPPPVSAKKINGTPAYKLARKGREVHLRPVEVETKHLEVVRASDGKLEISVRCTAGTYIRSLAHDLGQALGCGAILNRLRRIEIGSYRVEEARGLEELARLAAADSLENVIIPTARMLEHIPGCFVGPSEEVQIRHGRPFRTSPFTVPPGSKLVRALSRSGDLVAVGQLKIPNLYHPYLVL
jgi:tRNA pseudouridine55 synthase